MLHVHSVTHPGLRPLEKPLAFPHRPQAARYMQEEEGLRPTIQFNGLERSGKKNFPSKGSEHAGLI